MKQVLRCEWLPERARRSYTARSGFLALSRKIKDNFVWCFIPYNKSFIDQACSVKMAGYWPRSFFPCLRTETKSRSINTPRDDAFSFGLKFKISKRGFSDPSHSEHVRVSFAPVREFHVIVF